MISLKSLPAENIERAREDYVNHVFAFMLVKIIKTKKNLGRLSSKNNFNQTEDDELKLGLINESKSFVGQNEQIEILLNKFSYKEKLSFTITEKAYLFLKENLHSIISSPLENIINPNNGVFCAYSALSNDDQETILKFFSYSNLRDGYKDRQDKIIYSLYNLGETLGLRTCPYCNKNYIITIRINNGTGKLINAQLDHWIPQSKYSIFQTSFYNLIPSCSNCNSSIKRAQGFSLATHIHPYTAESDLTSKYQFNYFEDEEKHPIVTIDYLCDGDLKRKLQRTFQDFKTEKIYGAQMLELKDMIELANEYGDDYIETLQNAFPEVGLSKERIYNLLFNTSQLDENHHLRPLSKFRYDMLKKLRIIKPEKE